MPSDTFWTVSKANQQLQPYYYLSQYSSNSPSFGSAMSTTSTTSYKSSVGWRLVTSKSGDKDLIICIGTYVKSSGDNSTTSVSFPITYSKPPLVFLQMGTGNGASWGQYRDGELVNNITTTGFTTTSGCGEQSRMCYFAIGW